GVLLLAVGFAYKVSGAPFHQWTPDVYEGAPLPVTAFMSVGTKAAAFAMIIRVFNAGLPHLATEWAALLAFVAACSMIVGNLAAIVQSSLKRLLAYSGVAQAGYILIGVVAGSRQGIGAALFYLVAYLLMNFGAFAVLLVLVTPERRLRSTPVSVASVVVPGVLALAMSVLPNFVLTQGLTSATQLLR